jgi:hypothetical protein
VERVVLNALATQIRFAAILRAFGDVSVTDFGEVDPPEIVN